MRADQLLLQRQLATSRSQAQRLIAAGVQWRVSLGGSTPDAPWKRVGKNSDDMPVDAQIELLDAAEARYVSRGGLKLEGALASSGVKVDGRVCLDVGQSTGGFTDCLLQHGAKYVVGVDVGQGQLHPSLREHSQVLALEHVNARELDASVLIANYDQLTRASDSFDSENDAFDVDNHSKSKSHITGDIKLRSSAEYANDAKDADDTNGASAIDDGFPPDGLFDLITGDLSFISQTLVLSALAGLLKPGGDIVMLVKPQFELQPGQVGKGGIVKDAALYDFVEARIRNCYAELSLTVLGWFDSPIQGGDGNREFFIHARSSNEALNDAPAASAAQADPQTDPDLAVEPAAKSVRKATRKPKPAKP